MKKLLSVLLITILLTMFSLSPVYATLSETEETANIPSITMGINEEIAIVNGAVYEITAPILVLNKTYVDIYAVASFFDVHVDWLQPGVFKATIGENTVNFTHISQWSDLTNLKHHYFAKDSKIFVSLRELADMAGYNIIYTNGLITIGNQDNVYNEAFYSIDTYNFDEYIYTAYPYMAKHVVNPYQEYSYETMMSDAKQLHEMYPDLINTSSIGQSVEGRELLLIEFGKGPDKIFVCGTHHAREYIATTYLMYAIDRYAYAYRNNSMWGKYSPREILDSVTFCIVPMVNPDGVNLVQNGIYATSNASDLASMGIYEGAKYGYSAWKANIRGVDVNWNYDKDWSIEKNKNARGSTGFNGNHPNSEPETVAVSNYVDNNSFEAFFSFHTQGQIFYWADNDAKPSNIQNAIAKDTGFTGYKESATGVGGSFFDYVYRKFKKPTVTIELCPYIGNYPYPDSDFNTVWNPAKNILLVAANEILYNKSVK